MGFENPFLLFGLLGALIPIIIHLIHRRRATPLPFAALSFILKTNKKVARRLKLKQLLILALRILLICAIPIALSRPFSTPNVGVVGESVSPLSVVIIVDNSLSMSALGPDGKSNLSRAKEKALSLIDTLSSESNIGVVEAGGACEAITPELTFERGAATSAIEGIEQQDGSGSPEQAMRVAEALLARSALQDRRVLYISDLQATEWEKLQSPWSLEAHPSIQFESVGPPFQGNCAVTHVEAQRAREVSPNHIRVTATVESLGVSAYEGPVSLQLGDKNAQNTVKVEPGEKTTTTFLLKLEGDTASTGEVWIQDDLLGADDRRNFSLQFNRSLEVLVINGAPRNIPYRDELFFLEKALQFKNTENPIRVIARKVNEVKPQQFKTVDVVVLANVLKVPKEWPPALEEFVGNGGGLLFAGGDNVTVEYNSLFGTLLPMPVRAVKSVADSKDVDSKVTMIGLDPLNREHAALRIFQSVDNASIYDARFHTYMLLDGPTGGPGNTQVIATYNNGAPFLVESRRKRGRLMFWSNTLDQDWGNLAIQTSFVPLLRNLLLYVGGRLDGAPMSEAIVGEASRIPFRTEDVRIELTQPDGKVRTFELLDQDSRKGLFVEGLNQAGLYQLAHTNKNDPTPRISFFPVYHPGSESSVASIKAESLIPILSAQKEGPGLEAETTPITTDPLRTNLWPYVLLALFGLLTFEAVLAARSR